MRAACQTTPTNLYQHALHCPVAHCCSAIQHVVPHTVAETQSEVVAATFTSCGVLRYSIVRVPGGPTHDWRRRTARVALPVLKRFDSLCLAVLMACFAFLWCIVFLLLLQGRALLSGALFVIGNSAAPFSNECPNRSAVCVCALVARPCAPWN